MSISKGAWIGLTSLAVVFAIGLTYAAIELPRVAHQSLAEQVEFPGYDPGIQPARAEAFYARYHLRPIGYTSLGLIVALIIAGLLAERQRLATAGAIIFFLPVFGHFAISMFFLASLGMLRVIWLPILDRSMEILRLGDVAYLPYMILVYPAATVGLDIRGWLPWLVMGIGQAIFVLGVVAWLYARASKRKVADFWLYRLSRHPQYLGWIIWSYGLFIYMTAHREFNMKLTWQITHSLPWLLSTLVIVGVALLEEIRMKREAGTEYAEYRRQTPFLLPLPRLVSAVVAAPARLVLRGKELQSGHQVLLLLFVYALLLTALSVPFLYFHWPPRGGWWAYPYNVYPFR